LSTNYLVLVICFGAYLRKIFSEKIKQNDQQDQKDNNKPIPLVPGFKHGNFIFFSVHLKLKIQITNPKKK
jgi:hypothetical protein